MDDSDCFVRAPRTAGGVMPRIWQPRLEKIRDLRYGENPHQTAAWYRDTLAGSSTHAAGLGAAIVHQGKELSFTNLLDLDASARLVAEFDEPAAAVVKHTDPSGVATGATTVDAYLRAREADPLSAFGGIVGLNRPIHLDTARALTATFIEAVIAPALIDSDDVRAVLATKANLRVVTATIDRAASDLDARSILGAWLVQTRDRVTEAGRARPAADGPRVVTRRAPTPEEWEALRFAWRVCAHVKSNTVIFTGRDVTRAIGAGQMSRVDAVKAAVMKAGGTLRDPSSRPTRSFPSATASMRWRRRGRRRSRSPAARCATPRS